MFTPEEIEQAFNRRMEWNFFRKLTPQEVQEFVEYADTHDPILSEISLVHPVIIWRWQDRGLIPKHLLVR